MNRIKLYRRLKIVFEYGVGQVVPSLTQIVLSFIVVKNLSLTIWGEYIQVIIWLNLAVVLVNFGNKNALLKKFSQTPASMTKYWQQSLVSRSLLLFLIGAGLIFTSLFESLGVIVWVWLAFQYLNSSYNVLILYNRNFKFASIVEIIAGLVLIMVVIGLGDSLTVKGLIVSSTVILGAKGIIFTYFYRKMFLSIPVRFNWTILAFSLPFFMPMLLGTIRYRLDAYYASIYLSSDNLGLYHIYISILGIWQLFVAYTISPFVKNLYRLGSGSNLILNRYTFFISLALAVVSVVVSYVLFQWVYNLSMSLFAYTVIFSFTVTLLPQMLLVNALYKEDNQKQVSVVVLFVVAIQVVMGYWLLQIASIDGAMWLKILGQWIESLLLFGVYYFVIIKRQRE